MSTKHKTTIINARLAEEGISMTNSHTTAIKIEKTFHNMFCWLVVPCATLFLHTRHPLVRSLRPLSSRTDFLRSAKRGKSFFSERWKAFRVINPQSRIQRVALCNLNFFSIMKLALMWQSCIIYPFNWGSFKYSSRVIFHPPPRHYNLLILFSCSSGSVPRAELREFLFLDERALRDIFSFSLLLCVWHENVI